jgi:hypothetical protein
MTEKLKIKVIKKGTAVKNASVVKAKPVSKREAAREMVSNVTNWVSDFQNRKRQGTKLAIENLFGQQIRPTES